MPRSVPVARAVAVLLVLALAACDGEVRRGVAGAAGVRDPYFPKAGNGGYDVTHYGLTVGYDPEARRLSGEAEITARAERDLSAFNLDLKGMDVESVEVAGEAARFSRGGGQEGQELTVRPRDDLDEGAVFTAVVRYSGSPETITDPDGSEEGWLRTADGALGLGEPTGSMAWFPGNHHPSDKATYDITVTVPEGLRAVSNGELRSEVTKRGRTSFAWHVGEPMASYVATVAVGEYEVRRSKGEGVPPVYTAVDPSQVKESRSVLARIPEVMKWAELNFGPYPFSSVGAIVEREDDAGYALETQNRPVFPGAPSVELLVHELAHQWYGNSVTPKTWRDMWLNEGFATYAEWLWAEDHGGDSAQDVFDALYRDAYYDTREASDAVWAFPPAKPPSAARISDSPVYQRGGMVLHKIRQSVGDDTFYDIVQGWAAAHRHGNADTADFTAYVEKKAPGVDFSGIWKDWLYGDGKPDRP
ncbi:M1 family metallopeptidase [Streptomyces sp. NBC_00878]|uniref:M1 family metallopeptidase n=1 Tax=Streptomyces sp. NBC_00878 TaxID=2975854 RepID=UPI0022543849|nr:M1 family metallopeptidase [Streptomyces sp. NBC_00878]MCX4906634.1 M1 family metallopeptidase [Streptomyces sp. NBC_00878]